MFDDLDPRLTLLCGLPLQKNLQGVMPDARPKIHPFIQTINVVPYMYKFDSNLYWEQHSSYVKCKLDFDFNACISEKVRLNISSNLVVLHSDLILIHMRAHEESLLNL